jgi:hypothetical protein
VKGQRKLFRPAQPHAHPPHTARKKTLQRYLCVRRISLFLALLSLPFPPCPPVHSRSRAPRIQLPLQYPRILCSIWGWEEGACGAGTVGGRPGRLSFRARACVPFSLPSSQIHLSVPSHSLIVPHPHINHIELTHHPSPFPLGARAGARMAMPRVGAAGPAPNHPKATCNGEIFPIFDRTGGKPMRAVTIMRRRSWLVVCVCVCVCVCLCVLCFMRRQGEPPTRREATDSCERVEGVLRWLCRCVAVFGFAGGGGRGWEHGAAWRKKVFAWDQTRARAARGPDT